MGYLINERNTGSHKLDGGAKRAIESATGNFRPFNIISIFQDKDSGKFIKKHCRSFVSKQKAREYLKELGLYPWKNDGEFLVNADKQEKIFSDWNTKEAVKNGDGWLEHVQLIKVKSEEEFDALFNS